jgi:nucleoside 2-deoxyribosyltransferase
MIRRLYLAGPDVFLPNAIEVGRAKVELCRRFGFEGRFPLDNEPAERLTDPAERGQAIYRSNVELMLACDAILANLTPFRGPSADAGTVFEVGFFAALAKPIFAYSSDLRTFAERTSAMLGLASDAAADGEGRVIESFELPDNLMLPGAVRASGGEWIVRPGDAGGLAAFEAFEECLRRLQASSRFRHRTAAASG